MGPAPEQYEIYISINGFIPSGITKVLSQFVDLTPNLFVVVTECLDMGSLKTWFEIHRTETIRLTGSLYTTTNFTKELVLNRPRPSTKRILRFQVYNRNGERSSLEYHSLLAQCEIILPDNDLLEGSGKSSTFDLQCMDGNSITQTILLDCEKVEHLGVDIANLEFKGSKFKTAKTLWKTKDIYPFLVLYRKCLSGVWTRIWTTEVAQSHRKAKWMEICIPLRKLCNGDYFRELKVDCWMWRDNSDHSFIGSIDTTFHELLTLPKKAFMNENQEKRGGLKVKRAHVCLDREFQRHCKQVFDVLDELGIHFYIQYKNVNCNFLLPLIIACPVVIVVVVVVVIVVVCKEIHLNVKPDLVSECKEAIEATCKILERYDKDKLIQCFGFYGDGQTRCNQSEDCVFPLDPDYEQLEGYLNVLKAYDKSLQCVGNFPPESDYPRLSPCLQYILDNVVRTDEKAKCKKKYFVLLVVTDGKITNEDFRASIDTVVEASNLPISIVLVGVGGGDFSKLFTLDGDNSVLSSSKGQLSARDIVQFVPYHNYRGKMQSIMTETMWEIPTQFLSFMSSSSTSEEQESSKYYNNPIPMDNRRKSNA